MAETKISKKLHMIILVVIFLMTFLTGCGEENWDKGHGELSDEVGNGSSSVDGDFFVPDYSDFVDFNHFIEKTEYHLPTGDWFDGGKLGYGISAGTMLAGEDIEVILFGHDPEGVKMERDIRIQLAKTNSNYEKTDIIIDEVVHVDTITGEEEIYTNQLPDSENGVYLLSAEVIGQNEQVEDTLLGIIYVPAPEINAKLTTDMATYKKSDNQATLTLENFGPTFLSFGKDFTIEKKINNEWYIVPLDLEFVAIGLIINPNDTFEQTFELTGLKAGKYRIVKEFNADSLDLQATLAAEFTVE